MRERLIGWRRDPRLPGRILALAMFASSVLVLWMGRGTSFSGDEVRLVVATPGLDLETLLEPHGGHLLALGRLVYWPILELSGLDYRPFRVLALLTVLVAVGLLYLWARRRTDPWIALALSVLLLFFGSDPIHLFQGNGFIVISSIAFGMGALLAFDRNDRAGDLLACLLLCLGILSYTVILAFVAGVACQALLARQWRRLWVAAVPLLLYLLWRVWLTTASVENGGGGIDLTAVLLVPSWAFHSIGGVLVALAGLAHDFTPDPAGLSPAAPAFAVAAIGVLVFALLRERITPALVSAGVIALALWSMQALAAGDAAELRLPGGDSRYMYPGAFVVALVIVELVGRRPIRNRALGLVAVFTVLAVAGNVHEMKDQASYIRESGREVQSLVGAVRIGTDGAPVTTGVSEDGEAAGSLVLMAQQPYGSYGFGPAELAAQPEARRQTIDRMIATFGGVAAVPAVVPEAKRCLPAAPGEPLALDPGSVVLKSESGGNLTLGAFAEGEPWPAGRIPPGGAVRLELPGGDDGPGWRIRTDGSDLSVCEYSTDSSPGEAAEGS